MLPADGMSAAAEKVDFGVSRWQLGKKNFIPGFVTSSCRFVEQRRPVSACASIRCGERASQHLGQVRADQVASLVQVSGIPFRRLRKCNTQTFSAGGNLVQPSTCLERVLSVFADFCRLSSLGGQMKKLLVALVATLVAVSMAGCVGFGKGKAPPPRVVTKG